MAGGRVCQASSPIFLRSGLNITVEFEPLPGVPSALTKALLLKPSQPLPLAVSLIVTVLPLFFRSANRALPDLVPSISLSAAMVFFWKSALPSIFMPSKAQSCVAATVRPAVGEALAAASASFSAAGAGGQAELWATAGVVNRPV